MTKSKGRARPRGGKGIRQALRQAADENSDVVVDVLFDALDADKTVHFNCRHCAKSNAVKVEDHRVRVDAADKLVQLGFGRLKETTDVLTPEELQRRRPEDLTPDQIDLALARLMREHFGDDRIRELLDEMTGPLESPTPLEPASQNGQESE